VDNFFEQRLHYVLVETALCAVFDRQEMAWNAVSTTKIFGIFSVPSGHLLSFGLGAQPPHYFSS
jgi:hypothetical protein